MMDYDADDTPHERKLRQVVWSLRHELKALVRDAEYALERLDEGQRTSSSLYPGRTIDASKANGYAAQMDALLDLPWDDERTERIDQIVKEAGR